ncbi:MAG TPA: hypothetical protein DD412_04410 [Holosporales bacterium]|nr:hypothetical protein [Holosporales bacterium]
MFDYLKPYIGNMESTGNRFHQLSLKEIENVEKRLGYKLPPQLRFFYDNVGYGFFRNNHDLSVTDNTFANRLLDPESAADIKLLGYDSGQILPSVKFAEDELPIFEIADGGNFFVMKPQSDNPNAVYEFEGGELVEESLERFIWRLYYESPLYYMKDWGGDEDA